MSNAALAALLLGSLFTPTLAFAQAAPSVTPGDDLSSAPQKAPAAPPEALPKATLEALKRGDAAVLARDYSAAIEAYQKAIISSPQSALPHYRMGQAQVLKGQPQEAELSYAAALRFSGKNLAFRRKVLFCLADLAERRHNIAQALEGFSALASEPVSGEPELAFASISIERKKRLSEYQQLAVDSAQVKQRIEKRLKEAESLSQKPASNK